MLKKNTDQIIAYCRSAIDEYDKLCQGFLDNPGKEGINRRIEFIKLVNGLQKNTPEEAFIKLYDFYLSQKLTSRLNKIIENKLMRILAISTPQNTNPFRALDATLRAENYFHQQASVIKSEMGISDNDEFLLMSI